MSKYLRYNFLNMAQMYINSFAPPNYPLIFQFFPTFSKLERTGKVQHNPLRGHPILKTNPNTKTMTKKCTQNAYKENQHPNIQTHTQHSLTPTESRIWECLHTPLFIVIQRVTMYYKVYKRGIAYIFSYFLFTDFYRYLLVLV